MKTEEIIARVRTLYPEAVIDVEGGEDRFDLHVIDEAFAGRNIMRRQKSIAVLFKDDIRTGALQALSVKAKGPREPAYRGNVVRISH